MKPECDRTEDSLSEPPRAPFRKSSIRVIRNNITKPQYASQELYLIYVDGLSVSSASVIHHHHSPK